MNYKKFSPFACLTFIIATIYAFLGVTYWQQSNSNVLVSLIIFTVMLSVIWAWNSNGNHIYIAKRSASPGYSTNSESRYWVYYISIGILLLIIISSLSIIFYARINKSCASYSTDSIHPFFPRILKSNSAKQRFFFANLSSVWESWHHQIITESSRDFNNAEFMFNNLESRRYSSCPFISGDTFRGFANHIYDESKDSMNTFDPYLVKENDVVFVKTDYILDFFNNKHGLIQYPYTIITHNSDFGFPFDQYGDASVFLDDPRIRFWFGQNLKVPEYQKTIPIPIGIANNYLDHGNIPVIRRHIQAFRKFEDRNIYIYVNFAKETNPTRCEAIDIIREIPGSLVVETKKSWEEYLDDLTRSVFVLSPPGNGIDCHRTWEALSLGAIPIVESSTINPIYRDMPVLVVSSLRHVTRDLLENFLLQLMQKREFSIEKAFCNYWRNLFIKLKD